jgi:hypothetical protein
MFQDRNNVDKGNYYFTHISEKSFQTNDEMKTAWFIRKFSLTRDKSPGVKNDL